MNIKTVTPIENTLKAFQIEYDNMQEVVDFLNDMFGHAFTFTIVEDSGIKWINQASEFDPSLMTPVSGDWAVINYGRVWFLSNYDFINTYEEVK